MLPEFFDEEEELASAIYFHCEDIDTLPINNESDTANWLKSVIEQENAVLDIVNYIFCTDEYLYSINMEYLQHDTYTDVITFPYSTEKIEGDIFISVERVRENATNLGILFQDELNRVMLHGLLHLIGYDDKPEIAKLQMTDKENFYLTTRTFA